jgi:formamidopyrimidine-DNA glycosylase
MPELPEAETIVRGLRPAVVDETVRRVEVVHEDILRQPRRRFADRVRHATIRSVGRRGKNVLLHLDTGDVLAVNLGMTGRLLPFPTPPRGDARPTHPAIRFRFADGGVLVYDDMRRFGTVECLTPDEWAERDQRMGPEPLADSFTAEGLHADLSRSRSPLRSWLLDQRRIAGVGNIYANEAAHAAGVHPRRPARSVTEEEASRLHAGLREILAGAIQEGGTTIRDYRNASGERGEFARQLAVYGREGEPCPECGSSVERTVFGNRSAFFCPACQPPEGAAE